MSKVLFILTFLVTSIAFAGSAKPVECATSNGKIQFVGTETIELISKKKEEPKYSYNYVGEFHLATPRSDRHYVVGDLYRNASFADEQSFLATANILVVDATGCSDSQSQSHCTLVRRATVPMLCSYIEENN